MHLILAALVSLLVAGLGVPARAGEAACPDGPAEFAVVEAVGEGLTLVLSDGRTIALAGIEAPKPTPTRPTHPQDLEARLRRDLVTTTVGVAPLAARDRWAAVPALVFTEAGNLAEALLEQGDVRMRPNRAAHPCRDALLAMEQRARRAGVGAWGDPAMAVLDADAPNASDTQIGGFSIVEGTVASVGETATRLYLNLGKARGGFALSLPKRNIALMQHETVLKARVVGARLRARGIIDRTSGLRIDISDADVLEVIEPSDKTDGAR